jgi:hypothetical protein
MGILTISLPQVKFAREMGAHYGLMIYSAQLYRLLLTPSDHSRQVYATQGTGQEALNGSVRLHCIWRKDFYA